MIFPIATDLLLHTQISGDIDIDILLRSINPHIKTNE
jgi:hypothetical protein